MTRVVAKPKTDASAADHLREGHSETAAHLASALPHPLAAGQHEHDTHSMVACGDPLSGDQARRETQTYTVAAELLFCAEYLDDIEKVRIATENRLRSMIEAGIDARPYEQQAEAFRRIEHEATVALRRAMRRHPLGPWVKRTKGVGEKQGARLIAAIGDVAYNHLENRPRRGPAELWAYCGYHCLPADHMSHDIHSIIVGGETVAAKRRKGVKSNWNVTAKMRAFLIAESCIKQMNSPYRTVYDRARTSWADRDVKDGHKHNHALRLVAKAVLKDLFLEAKAVGA